jgi:hypothetical protein
MNRKGMIIILLLLLAAPFGVQAQQTSPSSSIPPRDVAQSVIQESGPPVYYRLDFTIRETDGEKLVDTRNYSMWVQSGILENVVAGSEVPYPGSSSSINYRNVGVSISCSIKDAGDGPKLDLRLEISDAHPPAKDSTMPAVPVFRKVQINSRASLLLGKPTTVSITEDPGSRHRFQVDVTATKLK